MSKEGKAIRRAQVQIVDATDPVDIVDSVAFDEMNLVELPFALLTSAKEQHTDPVRELALSTNGGEALVADGRGLLPTALAERAVLALLWLTMSENGFKTPTIRFPLRKLIHDYMYPDRTANNRVGGAFYKRIEDEVRRVAHTRIVSSRWYDKALGRQTHMDASIIDYIQVIEEGGRNKPRVLEIRWGEKLFRSIQEKYTKALDVRTILQIERPLDLRFYRWLDRQLGTKSREVVQSCQNFARFKLLMRGQKIDRGGRTASSYIVAKLTEALERLDDVGFSVRMTVDKTREDYRLIFDRLEAGGNEARTLDPVEELVAEFQRCAHGRTANSKRHRVAPSDRAEAQRWLDEYGYDQAHWMVGRAVAEHGRGKRASEPLYRFKGLSFYEAKVAADYEKQVPVATRRPFDERRFTEAWENYCRETLAQAKATLGRKRTDDIEAEVTAKVLEQYAQTNFKPADNILKAHVRAARDAEVLRRHGAMTEEQFRARWATDGDAGRE